MNSQPYDEFPYYQDNNIVVRTRPYVDFYYHTNKIYKLVEIFLSRMPSCSAIIKGTNKNTVEIFNEDNFIKYVINRKYFPLAQRKINWTLKEWDNTALTVYDTTKPYEFEGLELDNLVGKDILICTIFDTEFNNMFDILVKVAHELFLD